MAPNTFTIRPSRDAEGNYDGSMSFNPELLKFGDTKAGKNNMKFTNIMYDGKRILVETPEMDIPAGVVQYPKAEDVVPGDRVSYSLLMSFDGIDEKPELRAYKEFLETIQERVLDMAVKRSADLFGKIKSKEVLQDVQSIMVRESDKYAPSCAIGLPFTAETKSDGTEIMKPLYTTFDFDKIMNNGLRKDGSPHPDSKIPSIHEVDTRRGSVKVVFPLSSVWSSAKGFGVSVKAKDVLLRTGAADDAFGFDVGAKKSDDDPLLEPSDDEGDDAPTEQETDNIGLDNLGLDDDE